MRVRVSRVVVAVIVGVMFPGLAGWTVSAASMAETSAAAATEVTELSAEVVVDTVEVTGSAVFGGQDPVIVGEDIIGDAPVAPTVAAEQGLDIAEIALHQPDPDAAAIDFVIRVTQLNAAPPPEIIRYLWQFMVGDEEYWVQAKTADLATVLDDPAGTVEHIPNAFRLRGNCEQVGVVSTCGHVAWLDGTFDVDNNEIRMSVPVDSDVAPEFTPGAVIRPEDGVTASFQAGASTDATSDTAIQESDYSIPAKSVQLGIAPAGSAPGEVSFLQDATLAENGSFTGELATTDLEEGDYEVFAKACFAENCGVRSAPFTVQRMHWATGADASSEYSATNWGAIQATGAPNTYPTCGDRSTAWAPESNGSDPEWLTVTYDPPVDGATRLDLYETNKDGFVTEIELERDDGSTETIFTGPDPTTCAGILSVPLEPGSPVVSVTIHTQVSGWEEIDAVGVSTS